MRTDCRWGGFPAWSQLGIHTALPGGFTDTENLLVDMGTVSGVGGPVHFYLTLSRAGHPGHAPLHEAPPSHHCHAPGLHVPSKCHRGFHGSPS